MTPFAATGPVFPIVTPFTRNGDVAFDELERYADFLIQEGAETLMVTIGTSRFNLLSRQEMLDINACVAATAAGRARVVVTTPPQADTETAIGFARHALKNGADAMLAVYPDRFYSEACVLGYFSDVCAACDLPILIHLAPVQGGAPRFGNPVVYPVPLVEKLCNLPNLAGMKEEANSPALAYEYNRRFADRLVIIGGSGGMRSQITAHQWGQRAYLTSIGNFMPKTELAFFAALCTDDMATARDIVFQYEEPFFAAAVSMGWHIALKAALAHRGLMSAWERRPMLTPTDEDLRSLYAVMENMPHE